MTNKIIKAARSIWGESAILPFGELARFYALAYRAGMERAARICDSEATIEGIAQRCAAAIRAYAQNPPKNEHDGIVGKEGKS